MAEGKEKVCILIPIELHQRVRSAARASGRSQSAFWINAVISQITTTDTHVSCFRAQMTKLEDAVADLLREEDRELFFQLSHALLQVLRFR